MFDEMKMLLKNKLKHHIKKGWFVRTIKFYAMNFAIKTDWTHKNDGISKKKILSISLSLSLIHPQSYRESAIYLRSTGQNNNKDQGKAS